MGKQRRLRTRSAYWPPRYNATVITSLSRRRSFPPIQQRRIDRDVPPVPVFLHPGPATLGEDGERRAQVAAVAAAVRIAQFRSPVNPLRRDVIGAIRMALLRNHRSSRIAAASEGSIISPKVSRRPRSTKEGRERRSIAISPPSHNTLGSARLRSIVSWSMPCAPNTAPASADSTPPLGQPVASAWASASSVASD